MGSLWGPLPDEETNARSFAESVAAFRPPVAATVQPAPAAPDPAPAAAAPAASAPATPAAAPVHGVAAAAAPVPTRAVSHPGKGPRWRHEVKLSSSKQGQQVAHSRGMGQLCKAAVTGSIRGSGNFVMVSFTPAGNITFYSTSEEAGLSTEDWMQPELQRWMTSRQAGEAFVPSGGEAAGGGGVGGRFFSQRSGWRPWGR